MIALIDANLDLMIWQANLADDHGMWPAPEARAVLIDLRGEIQRAAMVQAELGRSGRFVLAV